ncbi:MAG TPA: hypothetical protein VEY09_13350 [Pyrinomonadaceae bacterium]|nr:hypothetical protein [Pyrinomonadaceae bacterium]
MKTSRRGKVEPDGGDRGHGVHGGAGAREARREGGPRLAGWLGPAERQVVWTVLAVKAVVLLFGAQAYTVATNRLLSSPRGWLEIWDRWDAPHYLDLASEGYVAEGVEARWIVFYPLYPWLVRLAAFFVRDYLAAAFLVSGLASVALGLVLYRLARLDETEEVALGSVFFLLIFPTAYFLHVGYTESLFLALTVGAFLAARRRVWWAAGLLGFLCGLTRVNGLLLVPALAAEAYLQRREDRRGAVGGRGAAAGRRREWRQEWRLEWLWCGAAGAGFGCYLLLNYWVFGHPLEFLRAQEAYWGKSLTWPWTGLQGTWRALWTRAPSEAQTVGGQELLFTALGAGCTVWAWARLRASYAVWMTLNWLLWTSTKFVLSVPRYTLVLFPVFILFARAAGEHAVWRAVLVVWSLLFMGFFVTQFVQGKWGF